MELTMASNVAHLLVCQARIAEIQLFIDDVKRAFEI